ncbi:putative OsmC-like protein [Gracilibacillus halotolerans]|uniref:Putative OsmC-like protein n=1 Tax=Gracilibacillus halotolerans TaxID=74386 RepID=A0A841RFA9_9BACI|nr:OsmC family protein [Gracilibacillus halotolerans]MBB6512750.1 putative OsmC-like protein [Gracilibacillus halotolerans]
MKEFNMKEHGFTMNTEFGELAISADTEYGFRPFELMIASIVGCSSAALRVVLTKMRIDFENIKVFTTIERNETQANRIEKIHLHFVIQGEELREEKIERAISIARKNCGMIQSVQDSILVTESFEVT